MKYLKKLATVLCSASVAVAMLSSCEGSELFDVNSPDWLQERIDSIAKAKANSNEDIYSIGAPDYSSGWWADFSNYYIIPDGAKWTETFNLHINPQATNTYKNFALILTNDVERGGDGYKEYGAIRFDNQPSGNSEWGSIDRSCIESNLTFETDTDPGIERLGGIVTLTVDRSGENSFYVEMNNGDVKKTYNLPRALDNLNSDPANENIRCFLVVEGSYIDFLTCNIDQIRTTKTPDQQPVSMVLNRVPKKVLLADGVDLKDVFANVTATVTYDGGGEREIPASELDFVIAPDFSSLGDKTVVVVYNKTYKEQNADKAVTATAQTKVVESLSDFKCIGDPNNTTAFWGAHSENIKVEPNETFVSTFTNYTCGASNWNNFCVVLVRDDNSEYAVVRADNYGWGAGYDGNAGLVHEGNQGDWATWLAAMDGAKVTTYVTNNGDGTADVKEVVVGNNGETYTQVYNGINTIDPDNFYFRFTVDNSHIEFDTTVGDDNNTTAFWGAHSTDIQVPAGKTYSTSFMNYTSGLNNWNNFCVVLTREDNSEYAVVRADNYGWGAGYDGNEGLVHEGTQGDWATWLAAMDEAKVKVSVTNVGDGTANINAVMIGNNGQKYTQFYNGINTVDPSNLRFRFTIDNSHLVIDNSFSVDATATAAKRAVTRSRK